MAAATGLIEAAEATRNPYALSFALMAYGFACKNAYPDRALEAMRRGLVIAQDSGNRTIEALLASSLAGIEAIFGDPLAAVEYPLWRSATTTTRVTPRICEPAGRARDTFPAARRHEPAATIAGFAPNPMTAVAIPEFDTAITHLRDALGDKTYESLARNGETMPTSAIVAYAYDQIDQARAELSAVWK